MHDQPQQEHHWLQRLLGDWTYEMTADMGPDQPTMRLTGTERVRAIGALWVQLEGEVTHADGSRSINVMTLGYDPKRGRFVGTFVASIMTHLWLYDGALDAAGNVLALDSEGPTFTEKGGMTRYRDSIAWIGDDHRTLTSHFVDEQGEWKEMMITHYRRAARPSLASPSGSAEAAGAR